MLQVSVELARMKGWDFWMATVLYHFKGTTPIEVRASIGESVAGGKQADMNRL